MNRLEQWGAELAMRLRQEHEYRVELERTSARIATLIQQITSEQPEMLYGAAGVPPIRARQQAEPARPQDTELLPAVVSCPAEGMPFDARRLQVCPETRPHMHTADGFTHALAEL